jgi:hypothetical protein
VYRVRKLKKRPRPHTGLYGRIEREREREREKRKNNMASNSRNIINSDLERKWKEDVVD